MINALHGDALTSDGVVAVKRPRSPTRRPKPPATIIDLTIDDDLEAPPAKRQRSHTPVAKNRPVRSAKPPPEISSEVQPATPNPANQDESSLSPPQPTKKSPFQNIPAWRVKHEHQSELHQHLPQEYPVAGIPNGHTSIKQRQGAVHSSDSLRNGSHIETHAVGATHGPSAPSSSSRQLSSSDTNGPGTRAFRMPPAQPIRFGSNGGRQYEAADIMEINDDSDISIERAESFKFPSTQPLKFNPIHPLSKQSSMTEHEIVSIKRTASQSERTAQKPDSSRPTVDIPPVADPTKGSNSVRIDLPVRVSPVPLRVQNSPSQGIVINIPPTKHKQERKQMMEQLKKSTHLVKLQPARVHKVLGLTGFESSRYPTDLDESKLRKAAQPKKRRVDRDAVKLDLINTSNNKDDVDITSTLKRLTFIHPRKQVKAVLTDRFGEKFVPPLTFSNDVNNARLDGKFQFISSNIFRKGVKAGNYIGQPGCSCTGLCQIDCACLRKTFDDHISKGVEQVQSYERRPDGITVLTSNYINNYAKRAEISECNERCGCPPTCSNRVVQNGRTVPLEIFQTLRCGFGVRSSQPIVRGQFIELYLGEIITENDLCRREAAQEEGSSSYVYSLDWFPTFSQNNYHIDGHNFGSAMRFVNHSCNPNARTFTSLGYKSTKQIYDVVFFAIKDIPPGTEITIDYSPQLEGEVYEIDDEEVVQCLCGSVNCRKKLWRAGKERKGRKKLLDKGDD